MRALFWALKRVNLLSGVLFWAGLLSRVLFWALFGGLSFFRSFFFIFDNLEPEDSIRAPWHPWRSSWWSFPQESRGRSRHRLPWHRHLNSKDKGQFAVYWFATPQDTTEMGENPTLCLRAAMATIFLSRLSPLVSGTSCRRTPNPHRAGTFPRWHSWS